MAKTKSTPTEGPARGRPTGSTTEPCEPIRAVRPGCRKCGSSRLTRKAILREMDHHLAHADGLVTSRRRWTRARCQACGQWQTIVEDFNP